jgi:sulfite dehydrogenase (quinone) subunit SoeC
MNPAFSVIFLTVLIGAGQGLFLALLLAETWGHAAHRDGGLAFLIAGGVLSLLLTAAGLAASFFHLGRPERAWRTAAQWRTSWLSREVIALPLFMAGLFGWTAAHALDWQGTGLWSLLTAIACVALFICTAMIYASLRFLQEWASSYTIINFVLLGLASGFTLATGLSAVLWPEWAAAFGAHAMLFTVLGAISRGLSLHRNAKLVPKSSLQSAIGIRHPRIVQRAQGFMGGSFNTREFFHGRSPGALKQVKTLFIVGAFVVPLLLLAAGLFLGSAAALVLAFVVQFFGLLAERWFFFAQANHPQNLYYQSVS